jgi:hypothetical protein
MNLRKIGLLAACGGLAGCTTVEVRYEMPATSATEAARQAKDNLSYFALQSLSLTVTPKADSAAHSQEPAVTPPVQTTPTPAPAPAPVQAHHEAGGHLAQGAPGGAAAATAKKNKAKAKPADKPVDPAPAAPAAPATANASATNPAPSHDSGSGPGDGQPTGVATTVLVDGQEYDGKLVAIQATGHGFMMGGVSNFWKKTAITGTRYADTDRVQSVSVKAENLVATRIGQVATVAGYFISPGTKESGTVGRPDLPKRFTIDLSTVGADQKIGETGWKYTLAWKKPKDASDDWKPDGTVTWNDFNKATLESGKKVNYFPAPACVVMTLSISATYVQAGSAKTDTFRFDDFVASTPDLVRLEPLPIDGKLALSPICSSSVTGTMTADPYDTAFAAAAAAYKAYGDLKGGGSGGKDASATPKPADPPKP